MTRLHRLPKATTGRPIDVTRELRTAAADAAAVIAGDAATIFAAKPSGGNEVGAFRAALHVDGRNGSLRHDVIVAARPVPGIAHTWTISIRPAGAARVLPSFTGSLAVHERDLGSTLQLLGTYTPPLGPIGAVGDGVVGHHLVRQSLDRFLAEIGDRVERQADRLVPPVGRPAPYPPDLRPAVVPESWLG